MDFFDDMHKHFFPLLSMLREVRNADGAEAVEEILNSLTSEARAQLNREVSMLTSGVYSDPFIDYLRMRKYMEN